MGGQVEQLAEAVITDEAETAERLKKTDWPRGSRRFRHLGNRERADAAARATAQAEQRSLKRKALLEKQLSLPATEMAARQDQSRSAGGAGCGQRIATAGGGADAATSRLGRSAWKMKLECGELQPASKHIMRRFVGNDDRESLVLKTEELA